VGELGSSYRFAMARTRAAKPAAEDARPAAVGKLFSETIRKGSVESLGSDWLDDSSSDRNDRRALRHACVRGVWRVCGAPLRRRESSGG
jgi:hypothetical protein